MRRILFDVLEINIVVSLAILLVCLLEKKLCKRYGAGCLKMVWVILAIRLLIPYNFSLPFTEMRLLSIPGFEQEESVDVEMPSLDTTDVPESSKLPTVDLTDMNAQKAEAVPEINVETENAVKQPEVSDIPYVPTQEPSVQAQPVYPVYDIAQKPTKANAFSYAALLAQLWLIGTVAGLCYFIICSVSFYNRYNKSLQRLTDTVVLRKVNDIQEEMIGRKRLEVYESSAISSPMLIGLLHTKLVFPTTQKQWQDKELEYIVSHEIWHYRNKDLWLKLLLLLVWCLNWWNPFILLMKRKCFFYMELACDECVLKELEKDARGEYAEMLLCFAGKRNPVSAFSTNFGSGKKHLKQRLDYVLKTHKHKKGTVSILLICLLVVCAGLFISCGYKPEEVDVEKENVEQIEEKKDEKDSIKEDTEEVGIEEPAENTIAEFTYNHDYNRDVRCHEGYIYYVKKDGVYRMKEDGTGEEQLFANSYIYRRGIDLYGDYLYFIGSIMRGEQEESTIYRLNLETMEIVDALVAFSNSFPGMGKITIYENCLYVIEGKGWIGFQLSQTGDIVSRLEEDDNYLFKEDNEYNLLTDKLWSETTYQSEEWWDIQNKLNAHYVSASDAAACEKLLNGKRILSIYKDEALWSAYMRYEDGTKEYLCDVAYAFPIIITVTGMYYSPDLDGDVYYLDFETKEKSLFLEKTEERRAIWLVNYDEKYVYYAKEAPWEPPFDSEEGDRLMRIPRQGGNSEAVYEFDKNFRSKTLWRDCAIVGDYLYLNEEWKKLSPLTE